MLTVSGGSAANSAERPISRVTLLERKGFSADGLLRTVSRVEFGPYSELAMIAAWHRSVLAGNSASPTRFRKPLRKAARQQQQRHGRTAQTMRTSQIERLFRSTSNRGATTTSERFPIA
jgi:hypothetical protein